MTIEECITDCEQVIFGAKMMKQTEVYKYNKQLAEWLKELLAWRQFGENLGHILANYMNEEQINRILRGDIDDSDD